jgi:hypothetical protein
VASELATVKVVDNIRRGEDNNSLAMKKKLLIFDLNNVLLCKNKHRRTSFFLRPWAIEFVNEMKTLYDIAVWTSGRPETMNSAMQRIFGKMGGPEQLVFYWTQRDCTIIGKNPSKSFSNVFKKDLNRVWDHFPQYDQHNTVGLLHFHSVLTCGSDPAG